MSNTIIMSSPYDWLQFYQRNSFPTTTTDHDHDDDHEPARTLHHQMGGVSSVADATVVTTTVTSSSNIFGSSMTSSAGIHMNIGTASSSNSISSGSSSTSSHLNPERRVSKPIRRRRASRGTPVTLLNTDTHNFRAMVQQFTGVPNAPFSLSSQTSSTGVGSGATNLNFQLARHPFHRDQDPSIFMMQQQQLQQQQHLQRQQQSMFSLNNNNNGDHHDNDQELMMNNLRLPANNNMATEQVIQNGDFNILPNVFHGSSSN